MPLIRDGRFAADDWLRPEPGADLPAGAKLILPLRSADGRRRRPSPRRATRLASKSPTTPIPDALKDWFGRVELISVLFPKSADGRGFSIATRLRRLGFDGELRATGHLIADQYALARSCGFDTVEISEAQAARQPEAHWLEAERAMSLAYQRGYGRMRSILSARWAG